VHYYYRNICYFSSCFAFEAGCFLPGYRHFVTSDLLVLPKSRNGMTIPVHRSLNMIIFIFWCGFRYLEATLLVTQSLRYSVMRISDSMIFNFIDLLWKVMVMDVRVITMITLKDY
jgi:hypothetical protein